MIFAIISVTIITIQFWEWIFWYYKYSIMQPLFKEEKKRKSLSEMSIEIKMHKTATEIRSQFGWTLALH